MPYAPDVPLHVYEILEEEYVALHGPIPDPYGFRMPTGDGGGQREVEATLGWDFRLGHIKDPAGFVADLLGKREPRPARGKSERRRSARGKTPRADESGKEEAVRLALRKYLVGKLGEDFLSELYEASKAAGQKAEDEDEKMPAAKVEGGEAKGEKAEDAKGVLPRASVEELEEKLNGSVLTERDLYDEERYFCAWPRASTLELLRLLRRGACPGRNQGGDAALGVGPGYEGDFRRPMASDEELGGWWLRLNRLLLEDAFPQYFVRAYDIRLAAMFRRLHDANQSALCLSGGGIRSGTFALGLLQGLARHDLLEQFDYLSTVSGGGYVGSWLSAWLHRHPEGLRGVSREMKNSAPSSRIDPDPEPIKNLREYSNFITPKTGLLTADTWAFAGIYLRNLLLNWLVLIPLLAGVLMLPRLMLNVLLLQPTGEPAAVSTSGDKTPGAACAPGYEERCVKYAPRTVSETLTGAQAAPALSFAAGRPWPSQPWHLAEPLLGLGLWGLHWRHLLLLAGYVLGVWALAFVIFNRPSERGRLSRSNPHWYARTDQRSFLKHCLTPLLASAALLTVYWAWSQEAASAPIETAVFLGFGGLFILGGKVVASSVLRRGAPDDGAVGVGKDKDERPLNWRDIWQQTLALLSAAAVAGLLFAVAALSPIGDPVVGYGAAVRGGKVVRQPFGWTDWTRWNWWDSWTTEIYVCVGVPVFLLIYWAGLTTYVGVSSANERVDDEDREWWARFAAWLLIAALGWLVLTALVIFGPLALLESPKLLASVGGLSGLVAVLLGRSSATPAGGRESEPDSKKSKAAGLLGGALPLFGAIFLGAFVALVSLGLTGLTRQLVLLADYVPRVKAAHYADEKQHPPDRGFRDSMVQALTNVPKDARGDAWVGPNRGFDDFVRYVTPVVPTLARPAPTPRADAAPCLPVCVAGAADASGEGPEEADSFKGAQIVHLNVLHHTSLWLTLILGGLLLWGGSVLSRRINLNVFSLHGGYRTRLIRAFLGASRPPRERHPNPFTGFDPSDNLHMHELRWALFDEGDFVNPEGLARSLRHGRHPLSKHLRDNKLIESVMDESAAADTPSMVEALRTDLNGVLQREHLYDTFREYAEKSERVQKAVREITETLKQPPAPGELKGVLRGDYRLLLNRLMLEQAYPNTIRPGPPPPYKLMHVVNTSLNLVGGEKLAWQQRKAEPFSISPLHAGCFRLGYRRSRDYGGRDTGGISIGTAAAISGAAASSNMGYYTTSPVISLLLTLFNVRLGWWLGNPGPAGARTYHKHRPDSSVTPVLHEALGMTNDRYKYVYLTDGGHFENLAVYEMVLRRCRFVVAADAAEDADYRFGDLGNAVRKIRIDLGVPIDFPCIAIYGEKAAERRGGQGMYWAIGRIRYSSVDRTPEADDGLLLYIKPAVYGGEPRDVIEYKNNHPAFPHQSTGDQFFDEPQFESYRALGSYIMEQLCGERAGRREVGEVIGRAREEMLKHCENLDGEFASWLERLARGKGGAAAPGINPS